ncbi:MAG: bifunctional metallophosphatase/5'-nucleotidase [Myxococcales bacterium]|nr:bifunctional metallophosphatase/5'-nucleotidase [Myxococcales bacterium]
MTGLFLGSWWSGSPASKAVRVVARLVGLFGLLGAGLALVACGREGYAPPNLTDKDVHLTVLHTSDIHSRVLSYRLVPARTDRELGLDGDGPFGGIARIASILRDERAKADRVLYVDSGDLFQGAPIFNVFQGEVEARALSNLQIDAYVLGNHDFDNGGLILSRQLAWFSSYPVLAANYIPMNDSRRETSEELRRILQPYTIFNVRGLRVGVIGLANTSSLNSLAEGGNSLGYNASEQNETLQRYINLIKDRVDLVMALTHIGLTEDEHLVGGYYRSDEIKGVNPTSQETIIERKWIEGVRGLDVIMGGHHHVVLNPPKNLLDPDDRDVLLVHSGAFAKFVGRADLVVRNGEIVSHRFNAIGVTNTIKEDPDMLRMLEPYIFGLNQQIDTTRIFAFAPFLVPRFGRGTGDSSLGNLVSESMQVRRRVEADFALTNSLGIRTDLQPGPVSLEQFYEIFPFENTVTTLFVSGKEVQELLDFVTERSTGRGCQSQAQIAGMSFVMNCGANPPRADLICIGANRNPRCTADTPANTVCYDPLATEGKRTCLWGEPVEPFSSYKLAANDYIANGGSGFRVLQRNTTQRNTGVSLRDALVEYIEGLPDCNKWLLTVDEERKKEGRSPLTDEEKEKLVPTQYRTLPCILGAEDGRIRRRL